MELAKIDQLEKATYMSLMTVPDTSLINRRLDMLTSSLKSVTDRVDEMNNVVTHVNDALSDIDHSFNKFKNIQKSLNSIHAQASFKYIHATDYYSSMFLTESINIHPRFSSEYGFIIPPSFQGEYVCSYEFSDSPNTELPGNSCEVKLPMCIESKIFYELNGYDHEIPFIDKTTLSSSLREFKITYTSGLIKFSYGEYERQVDLPVGKWLGISFNPISGTSSINMSVTTILINIDPDSFQISYDIDRSLLLYEHDFSFPSSMMFTPKHYYSHPDQSLLIIGFASHKWAISTKNNDRLIGRSSSRDWEIIMFNYIRDVLHYDITNTRDTTIQQIQDEIISSPYSDTIMRLNTCLYQLATSVPRLLQYDTDQNIDPYFIVPGKGTHTLIDNIHYYESGCSNTVPHRFRTKLGNHNFSVEGGSFDYIADEIRWNITAYDGGNSTNQTISGEISSGCMPWGSTTYPPKIDTSSYDHQYQFKLGIDVTASISSWPGTVASCEKMIVTLRNKNNEDSDHIIEPSITVDNNGLVSFKGTILLGSISYHSNSSTTTHSMDVGESYTIGSIHVNFVDTPGSDSLDVFHSSSDLNNIAPVFGDNAMSSHEIALVRVQANFVVMQAPIFTNISFINLNDDVFAGYITALLTKVNKLEKDVWSLTNRVERLEKMLESSALKTLGDIAVGFVGVVPGMAAIVGPIIVATTLYAADAIARSNAESKISAIVLASLGALAVLIKNGKKLTKEMTEWMDGLRDMASDLGKQLSNSNSKFRVWRQAQKASLFKEQTPSSIKYFQMSKESYAQPFEELVNDNFIGVAHTKLSFAPFDAAKYVNDESILGSSYRWLHNRNVAPSHSELYMNSVYFIEDESFDVIMHAKLGVGTGIGNDMKMSRKMEILGIGNGSNGNTTLGFKTLFEKIDRNTGVKSPLRLPLSSTEEQLSREAAYYYKIVHSDNFDVDKLEDFILSKPWLDPSNQIYDDAYHILKESQRAPGMYVDAKKGTSQAISANQWNDLFNMVGEDYMQAQFVYDVLGNNCHKFANNMFSFITKSDIPDVLKGKDAFKFLSKNKEEQWARGITSPADYTNTSEIYDAMDSFFKSTVNSSPNGRLNHDFLSSLLTDPTHTWSQRLLDKYGGNYLAS